MSKLFNPFSLMILLVCFLIIAIFVKLSGTTVVVNLVGVDIATSYPSAIHGGQVTQTRSGSESVYSTDLFGTTEPILLRNGDTLSIEAANYHSLGLLMDDLTSHLLSIGVTLFRKQRIDSIIEGRIHTPIMLTGDIVVSCTNCTGPSSTSTIVDGGTFSVHTDGSSTWYNLTLAKGGTELVRLRVKPEHKGDHAKIDLAFDDSSPLEWGRKYPIPDPAHPTEGLTLPH